MKAQDMLPLDLWQMIFNKLKLDQQYYLFEISAFLKKEIQIKCNCSKRKGCSFSHKRFRGNLEIGSPVLPLDGDEKLFIDSFDPIYSNQRGFGQLDNRGEPLYGGIYYKKQKNDSPKYRSFLRLRPVCSACWYYYKN